MVLVHELAHDGHMSHKPDFHEAMHSLLLKVFPKIGDYAYVWSPVGTEGKDYVRWSNKPSQMNHTECSKIKFGGLKQFL